MTTSAPPVRRLYRRRDGRIVAGVVAGLADHMGIDVLPLRVLFVVSIAFGGLGVLLYAAFWVVVPEGAGNEAPRLERQRTRFQLVGYAALAAVMLLLAQLLGFGASLLWPAVGMVTGA